MTKRQRITVRALRSMKDAGEKITMLATYDYYTAKVLDQSGIDLLLVGDTLGMALAVRKQRFPCCLNTLPTMPKSCRVPRSGPW